MNSYIMTGRGEKCQVATDFHLLIFLIDLKLSPALAKIHIASACHSEPTGGR